MPDYKKMYLKLFQATEQAINTLIEAQRECEELYISEPETELRVISMPDCAKEEKEWIPDGMVMQDMLLNKIFNIHSKTLLPECSIFICNIFGKILQITVMYG